MLIIHFQLFHCNNFLHQILRGINLCKKIAVVPFKKVTMTLKNASTWNKPMLMTKCLP